MNNPTIQKGNLTYTWATNAREENLVINGTEVTYTYGGEDLHYTTFKNAIIGRPKGLEDHINKEIKEFKKSSGQMYRTITQNSANNMVGIYVLKP